LSRDPGSMNFGTLLKRHPNDWDVSRKVFIGGLRGDGGTKDRFDIEFHFSEVGKVTDVWISQKYGFAYVEMEDQKTALKAVKELNGTFMCGGTVTVEMAKRDDQKRKERELDLNMRWGDSKDDKNRDRVRDRGRSRSRSGERRSWRGEREREDREKRSRSWKDESEKEKFKERKRAPTVKDDFESWYNLDSLGESSQSTRSQEPKSVCEERRRGRSRSKERDWLRRREERSRSRERRRSQSKERRRNWSKERRRSRSRGRRWSREQRSRSRDRWMGEMSRSRDRRREEATRKSTSEDEDEFGLEGASGARTPSPSSCARLPPHLLGGWTVIPD